MKLRAIQVIVLCVALTASWLNGPSSIQSADYPQKFDPTEPTPPPDLLDPVTVDDWRAYVDYEYSQLRSKPTEPDTGSELEVIYGDDHRRDYYDISDASLKAAAASVCLVVERTELSDNGNGTYTLSTSPWNFQSGAPLCVDERFRGQQRAGFCTGFLVGSDIIATAGHCLSTSTCGSVAFVFSFWKTDSILPPETVISSDNVYFCAGIIDRQKSGNLDHSIVRLDREVVGRTPLFIRRSGIIPNNDPVAVIGHPVALPQKAAAGAVVKDNMGTIPYFKANLDTYGGNSGSPVFNLNNYTVEGILVRGATDFVFDPDGACTRSNVVPNTGSTDGGLQFEEISKTTQFASFIPELLFPAGVVILDNAVYGCSDTITIEMRDSDLAGAGSDSVVITTGSGDSETVIVTETPPGSAVFKSTIPTAPGGAIPNSGVIEFGDGVEIAAAYFDADSGSGLPATVVDSALSDCQAPAISNVSIVSVQGTKVTIAFDTDEPSYGGIELGTNCLALSQSIPGVGPTTSHLIIISGLMQLTDYYFSAMATDGAGNVSFDDNLGACYSFTTGAQPDYFTEEFAGNDNDLDNVTILFTPDGSSEYYQACRQPATGYPTDPAGGAALALGDDGFVHLFPTSSPPVHLYGTNYTSFFVGSNGYLTFGSGSSDFSESIAEHFAVPAAVAGLYDDLDPSQGGTISWKELPDRVAVTFDSIPQHNVGDVNSFQIELFFDSTIAITFLHINASDGIVGLSAGTGTPPGFVESDFSGYPDCVCSDPDGDSVCTEVDNCPYFANPDQIGCPYHGDPNGDGLKNVIDVTLVIEIAFRDGAPIIDPECPHSPAGRTDINCDGVTNVFDAVLYVDVAFRGGTETFCNPCACDPYPSNCP